MSKQNRTHTIQITDEQIKMVRSLAFRVDQLYIRHRVTEIIGEDGAIERKPISYCLFCDQGAYGQTAPISHTKKCIVSELEQEYGALNEQFMNVENPSHE